MKQIAFILIAGLSFYSFGQEEDFFEEEEDEKAYEKSFNSTRIINGHSVETLEKGILEFRIEHRFGDIAGENGGAQTMFGLDNSSDIRFAFEYGLTDQMMIGIGRSKGTGTPYRSLLDGYYKYRFLNQGLNAPVSMAVYTSMFYTYMKASEELSDVSNFPETAHRFSYASQVHISRSFGNYASIALIPSLVHRNYVANDDQNTLFALGTAARIGLTKKLGLNIEYYHVFDESSLRPGAKNSLSFAFDWNTFGHNFKIDLTNARGFGEVQYISGTQSDWLKGQFRLGFSITRMFQLHD